MQSAAAGVAAVWALTAGSSCQQIDREQLPADRPGAAADRQPQAHLLVCRDRHHAAACCHHHRLLPCWQCDHPLLLTRPGLKGTIHLDNGIAAAAVTQQQRQYALDGMRHAPLCEGQYNVCSYCSITAYAAPLTPPTHKLLVMKEPCSSSGMPVRHACVSTPHPPSPDPGSPARTAGPPLLLG